MTVTTPSRFTFHVSRFTPHVSRFTFYVLRFTFQILFAATIVLSPIHRFKTLVARPLELIYDDYISFQLFVADIPLLITAALWILSFLWYRRPVSLGSLWIGLPFLGVWVVGLIGVPWSADPTLSLYHLGRLVVLAVFALAVAEFGSIWTLAAASVVMIGPQTAAGLGQWVEQRSLGYIEFGERVLDPAKLGTSVVLGGDTRLLRAYGLSDHPNLLGGCLAFALILVAGALLHLPSPDNWASDSAARPRWGLPSLALIGTRIVLAGALAVGVATLIVTFSRSAWLGLAAGLVVLAAFHWISGRPKRRLILLIAGLAVGCLAVAPSVTSAFTVRLQAPDGSPRTEERSVEGRSNLNWAAFDLIQRRPLLGVGLGTFPIAHLRADPNFPDNFVPVHNIVLAATAETGLLGGLFYVVVLAAPFVLALRAGRRLPPTRAIATAGLAAVITVGMLDYYPWLLVPGRIWFFTVLGLWLAAERSIHRRDAKSVERAQGG